MPKKNSSKILALVPKILAINLVAIAFAHIFTTIASLYYPGSYLASVSRFFDLDQEYNLPSVYSGILLLLIAIVAFGLFRKTKTGKYFWLIISAFFVYWAADEVFIIHERTAEPIRDLLSIGSSDVYYHAWVILALPVIAGVGLVALTIRYFKRNAMTKEQIKFLSILFFFMFGIVVLEMLGTLVYSNEPVYRLLAVPAEELFEIGMTSFILWLVLKKRLNV